MGSLFCHESGIVGSSKKTGGSTHEKTLTRWTGVRPGTGGTGTDGVSAKAVAQNKDKTIP